MMTLLHQTEHLQTDERVVESNTVHMALLFVCSNSQVNSSVNDRQQQHEGYTWAGGRGGG